MANEVLKAKTQSLRLGKMKSELVDRARATELVFSLARRERDAWIASPARVAANMAAELGVDPKGDHAPVARDAAQMTVSEIAMQVCRMQGLRPFNEIYAVRMASHSTSDFPLILENSLSNTVARRIDQRMTDLVRASHRVDRVDYRTGRNLTLSATGIPAEIAEGAEIPHATAEEKGEFLNRVRDFAIAINFSNQAVQNDATAVGHLNQTAKRMG